MGLKIVYIGHSGFLVETERVCMLFDCIAHDASEEVKAYHTGTLPELSQDKPIVVFVSHKHQDHYSTGIWELRKQYPAVFYVLGKDISLSAGYRKKLGLTDSDMGSVLRAYANQTYELPEFDMKIETLKSTDQGVAYYVTVDGYTLYHAGDLHAWYWEGEGKGYVKQMQNAFEKELQYLKDRVTDVAFLLLDPRMEENAYIGIDRYLETMKVKHTFPMHIWKQYGFIEQYKQDRKDAPYIGSIHTITEENQTFMI